MKRKPKPDSHMEKMRSIIQRINECNARRALLVRSGAGRKQIEEFDSRELCLREHFESAIH